jgi:hypothetical protein
MELMKFIRKSGLAVRWLARLSRFALAAALFLPPPANASTEETFPVLNMGTVTYRNVTVTTKTPAYIVIMHSGGMCSLKVQDLPFDAKVALGYAAPAPVAAPRENGTSQTASQTGATQVAPVQQSFKQVWGNYVPPERLDWAFVRSFVRSKPGMIFLGVVVFCHLFFSFCTKLIVEKTANEPGALVWVPLLNTIPLVRAAGMSTWSALGMYVPVLNFAVYIVWCLKIAKARGQGVWVAILLILPCTSGLAFVYLAFAPVPPAPKPFKAVEVMTLEAA